MNIAHKKCRAAGVLSRKSRVRERPHRLRRILAVVLLIPIAIAPAMVFARGGGLRWGYVNEAQGYPLWNLWLMTNPWAQMSGWAIPHHSMAPNGLPPQYDNDGGAAPRSPYGNTWRTQPFDRSVAFTGSASQPSSYVPPNRFAASTAALATQPVPTGPYRIDRSLYPPYYNNYNNYWHSGYWGGGLRGWAQWGKALAERAFPRWSVGPLYYLSGYGQYRNPFVSLGESPSPPHLDYRKPLVDFSADETPRPPSTKEGDSLDDRAAAAADEAQRYQEAREFLVRSPQMTAGLKALDAAREAFRNKDYDTALRRTDEALGHLPRDSDFHEFRALVLFARGEYQQAAATMYAVLSVSPGWDWTTLSSMYADPDELTRHLRQLETYRKQHPDEAGASFLLAYHYMTCRHAASAIRQLRNVLRLIPDDNLVPPLIALFAGVDDSAAAAAQAPSADAAPGAAKPGADSGAELDPDQLAGEWRAPRAGVSDVNLKLSDEGEFTWTVPGATPPRRYTGFYATKGEQMTLISPRGQLPGKVTPREGGGFHFTLSENDPSDPGLTFGK